MSTLRVVSFEDRGTLPRASVIYFAISSEGDVLYTGQAHNLQDRWSHRQHRDGDLYELGVASIAWHACLAKDMTALENMMIDLFKPPLNKRGAKPEKTVLVGAHYPSEVRRALFLLQAETGKTAKQLLGEAINDLCAKDEPPSLMTGKHNNPHKGPSMANQLDLSLLASVSDPELRASLERLGNAMAKAPTQAGPDPKPSTTAKIIQFPLFPETTRPVSNDMARSALFSCIQGKDRRFIKDALLATVNGVEIRFTGEQLNQDDHDLLMQLVFMAHKRPIGTWITAPAYAILRALGRKVSGKQYRELRADISRLAAGMVSIRNTKAKIEFIGHHLITQASQHEISRHWIYRLDPALKPLYGDMVHTLIDWNQRMALKGKDLARWVQLYMATHAKPYPVKVDTLRQLSGSRAKALRNFRAQLRLALDDLIVNEDIVSWCIEMPDDLLFVNRGRAISSSQRRRLDRISSRT